MAHINKDLYKCKIWLKFTSIDPCAFLENLYLQVNSSFLSNDMKFNNQYCMSQGEWCWFMHKNYVDEAIYYLFIGFFQNSR